MQPVVFDPAGLRVGQGYDVHAFAEGRKLILGGVDVPHVRGLLGHSDADVLAHAISDALLGGIRGGDIGKLFPDTDPAFKDADSLKLLAAVADKVRAEGYDHPRRRLRHRRAGAEAVAVPRGHAREPGRRHGHRGGECGREGHHH